MSDEQTVSRERDGSGQDSTLLIETKRVLDNQMQMIQEQQNQATRVIRVLFTAIGLLLTLISIAVSADVININSTQNIIQTQWSFDREQLLVVALVFSAPFAFTLARIFHAALLVLSPNAEKNLISRILTFPIPGDESITLENIAEGGSDDKLNKPLSEITPRTGIDSQEARDISMLESPNHEREILDYHIGCIYGNELIIKSNRSNLIRIYRLTAFLSVSLGIALIYIISFIAVSTG